MFVETTNRESDFSVSVKDDRKELLHGKSDILSVHGRNIHDDKTETNSSSYH